jgi:hypothetical protein
MAAHRRSAKDRVEPHLFLSGKIRWAIARWAPAPICDSLSRSQTVDCGGITAESARQRHGH